jgi:replicative DNA helicase
VDLNKTIERIEANREQTEASFVFCLWKDPQRYDDYKNVNVGTDKTLSCEETVFYFSVGRGIRQQGFQNIDNITVDTYLADKPTLRKHYQELNGWEACKRMMDLLDVENTDGYFDQIAKMNSLKILATRYEDMLSHPERFDNSTNEEVYEAFELLNNNVSLTTGQEAKIESLVVDENYLQQCNEGQDQGISYASGAPLLNYLTLGAPIGDMYMLAGHSGAGKSSFIFEMMVIPFADKGVNVAIVSNEMMSKAYKNMLLVHILTKELNYWKITRKKLKMGHFSDEDWVMLRKAAQITKEKYSSIRFVKMFENNTNKLLKHIKRLARTGTKAIVYDTFKSDDEVDDKMWQALLMNSRRIFNIVNKEQIAFISTFQLALHTTNQRWLDASCLSNSKQIKEVVSELLMVRKLWQDEYTGEKFDCDPYYRSKDNPKVKMPIILDKDKTYVVGFLNKTRNDEDGQTILFQFDGAWNTWRELGYCTITNDHGMYDRR